jgi:hypothetical protein
MAMAGVGLSVERSQRVALGGDAWMMLGLATIATIAVVALYGSAPSPTPVPGLRAPTTAQVAGLTSALAKDWGRVRAADVLWMSTCYEGLPGIGRCDHALGRQIAALQRLADDVRAQRLAGTTLAPIVDGRFLRSIEAALAAKHMALARGRVLRSIEAALAAKHTALAVAPMSAHQDTDPLICIQPVGAAIQRAMGKSAGSHTLFLSYPHALAWFLGSTSNTC